MPASTSMHRILPVLHSAVIYILRIQSPLHNGPQWLWSAAVPPLHTEITPPFPPGTLNNTALPHNACGPHPTPSSGSGCITKYHVPSHLPHRYNAHRWSPPAEFLSPHSCEAMPDLRSVAPESRGPAFPKRNFLLRRYPASEAPPPFPLRKSLFSNSLPLLPQDMRKAQ